MSEQIMSKVLTVDALIWVVLFLPYLLFFLFFGFWRILDRKVTREMSTEWDNGYDQFVMVERVVTAFFCTFGLAGIFFHGLFQPIEVSASLAFFGGFAAALMDIVYCVLFKHVRLSLTGTGIYVSEYEMH